MWIVSKVTKSTQITLLLHFNAWLHNMVERQHSKENISLFIYAGTHSLPQLILKNRRKES